MTMVMTIIIVILCLEFFSFLIYDVYFNTRQAIANEMELVARGISKRAAPVMLFQEEKEGQNIISEASIKDSILLACLYNNKGLLFTEFKKKNYQNRFCPHAPPEHIGFSFKLATIAFRQDVLSPDGTIVASLYMVSDTRQVNERLLKTSIGALLFLLVAYTLSYIAVKRASVIITQPITNLVQVSEAVRSHNYSARAKRFYNDELGILVDTFNEMLTEVQKRDKALHDSNENLEYMVKKRTSDLEVAKIKAEDANIAKSEFLSNMSHEFRTPLHAMQNFSQYGIEEIETADRAMLKKYFIHISKVTERLIGLVEGILNIAQMESGTDELVMTHCDLAEIFQSAILEQDSLLRAKNLQLIYQKPDFSTELICHRDKIHQVITNLLSNAVKFTPSGSAITLSVTRKDHRNTPSLYVSVADQGVGVPEEEQQAIFKKFVQSTRTKTNAGGTGLGLSICAGIIYGHEGDIWVETNPEGGATFIFTIPLNLKEGRKLVKPKDL